MSDDPKDFPDADTRFMEALEEIVGSLKTGTPLPNTRHYIREVVDVVALRQNFGMTQDGFAQALGISVGTLRNWEQGRREPDGPAQRLLKLVAKRPDVALEVLGPEARAPLAGPPAPDATAAHREPPRSRTGQDRPADTARQPAGAEGAPPSWEI